MEKFFFHGRISQVSSMASPSLYIMHKSLNIIIHIMFQQTIQLFLASLTMSHLLSLPFESSGFDFKWESR